MRVLLLVAREPLPVEILQRLFVPLDWPVVFAANKDRPILFTALAWADVLFTLDKADFADVLGGTFYGLRVLLPYDFLQHEHAAGRL